MENATSPTPKIGSSGRRCTDKTRYLSYLASSAVANAVLPVFYIFIPLYAVKIGANALELGLVGGASYAVYAFMPFVMGHFSDRKGSRIFFITTSFVLLALVSFLYSVITNPIALIATRLFEGIGWAMLWPAIEAAITEDPARDSRESLSVFNYTWSGGAALGPAIGTLLVTGYSYSIAFATTGTLFVALIALNTWTVFGRRRRSTPRESSRPPSEKASSAGPPPPSSIRELFLSRDPRRNLLVWTCVSATVLSALTSAILFTFFGPYARSLGITVVLIGAITTTYGAVRFFSYLALSRNSLRERVYDNPGRNILTFTALTTLSALILLARDTSGGLYFLAFAIFAVGYSLVYAISQIVLIASVAPRQRGAGAGLFESSIGIGGVVGPIVAGAISPSNHLQISFVVPVLGLGLVLALLSTLSIVQKHKREKKVGP